jgi:diaminopimelate epimerase
MKFSKYSANGNDFILLNDPQPIPSSEEIRQICDRHFGIGADGVLILIRSAVIPMMKIFNSDGNEADMCANGLRIAFTHLENEGVKDLKLSTKNSSYTANLIDGRVTVEMTEVRDHDLFKINAPEFKRSFYVSTGVPHIVLLADSVGIENFTQAVKPFRYYPGLKDGANVNLVEIPSEKSNFALVRTFERGVEDETLSCGTGLTASALALGHWFDWKGHIKLRTKGGDHTVNLGEKIYYSGDVKFCFHGELDL